MIGPCILVDAVPNRLVGPRGRPAEANILDFAVGHQAVPIVSLVLSPIRWRAAERWPRTDFDGELAARLRRLVLRRLQHAVALTCASWRSRSAASCAFFAELSKSAPISYSSEAVPVVKPRRRPRRDEIPRVRCARRAPGSSSILTKPDDAPSCQSGADGRGYQRPAAHLEQARADFWRRADQIDLVLTVGKASQTHHREEPAAFVDEGLWPSLRPETSRAADTA